jgi:hypothetical protein
MLFSNLAVAIALTVLFPLGLMGLLAAGEWLERRTLATEEVVPRRLRRMATKPPEAVEAMVLEETAHVVAQYWSATGRPASEVPTPGAATPGAATPEAPTPGVASNGDQPATRARSNGNGGRHLRRPAQGRAGRHERRR